MPHRDIRSRSLGGTNLYLLAALAVVLSATPVHTQTWEPAARLWGWLMNKECWVETPNSYPLIHLYRTVSDGVFADGVYNLDVLSPDADPVDSLHGLRYIVMRGDINGNGLTDLVGRVDEGIGWRIVLDAYTEQERFAPWSRPGLEIQNEWIGKGMLEDLDRDGFNDPFTDQETHALISYGDSLDPLSQQSLVPYTNAETPNARAVCLGTLEGRACMLRITWWWVPRGNDSTQMWAYTLDVLNEQDLRERRDTIRYETVQRYDVGDYGWAYRDCFIIFDDVWQLTHFNARRTCLRVQLSGIDEHEPDPSFSGSFEIVLNHEVIYGQARRYEDDLVRIDGRNPFLSWFSANRITPDSSFSVSVPDLLLVTDPLTLETIHLGLMNTAYTKFDQGARHAACTTPDLDGDGISEVLLYYQATNPATSTKERLVDLYLTSDRPTVSVPESGPHSADSAQACAQAVRSGDSWTITCTLQPGMPMAPVDCFDESPTALVYDSLGRQVAELPVMYGSTSVVLHDPGTLPGSPLWAVMGSCTVRLQ